MKKTTIIVMMLMSNFIIAQDAQVVSNLTTFQSMSNTSFSGVSVTFNNAQTKIKGSVFLFDDWDTNGVITVTNTEKNKYLAKALNVNLKDQRFQAKINKDSIFSFNFSNIDNIVINNRKFKFYPNDPQLRIFEVLLKSKTFTILKHNYVTLVAGSPNPMVNRKGDSYVKKSDYFIKQGNTFKKFKLNKKHFLKLFKEKEIKAKIETFFKNNKLSYKNLEHLNKCLKEFNL